MGLRRAEILQKKKSSFSVSVIGWQCKKVQKKFLRCRKSVFYISFVFKKRKKKKRIYIFLTSRPVTQSNAGKG